jgi:cytochrome P450
MSDDPHRAGARPSDARKYDLYGPDFKRDPYPTFAAMRRDDPIYQQPGLDGKTPIWFVTRYADVEAMLRDPRFVRDPERALPPEKLPRRTPLDDLLTRNMLGVDGADHRRLRDLVSQGFTPKRVADLRPRIEAIAGMLLAPLVARGEADLIDAFAFPLPTIVILEMLGVPADDHGRFRAWANALLEPPMTAEALAEATRLLTEFTDYLRELFAERRARPRDDLLSALIAAEQAGDRLSENELFSTMVLLIVAGHETTVNLIANAVLALSERPDLRDALAADPSGLPRAVEEFLRYDGSVERALNRFAAEDVAWDGHLIRRGDPVIFILSSANRDEARFDRPDDLDPERAPNPHVAFGKGIHYCLGAPLARLEAEVALRALLTRLPNLRLAVPRETLRYRFLPGFRALEALPVRWDAR